jgi:hypothetical protein
MGAMGGMPMGGAQGMGAYGQMQQPYGGYQMQQQGKISTKDALYIYKICFTCICACYIMSNEE